MKDQILSYREMCNNEGVQTLQRGMNYRLHANYSVILMSQRSNAPYTDKIYDDGITIEYEGHDAPQIGGINPKSVDQPKFTKTGKLTENGKFVKTVDEYKKGNSKPEIVRVYEKLFSGIWSERGFFILRDYKFIISGNRRKVFRFILEETDLHDGNFNSESKLSELRSRIIPSAIKQEVYKRDGGKCVICGAKDELHFDHDLPFSKGGTSITAANIRILCARHNLEKADKIQ